MCPSSELQVSHWLTSIHDRLFNQTLINETRVIQTSINNFKGSHLGLYDTWGYGQTTSSLSPCWVPFSFSSVDPIIRNCKNNPHQIHYFSYFYACGKSTIKTKTTHYFKKLTKHFSFAVGEVLHDNRSCK